MSNRNVITANYAGGLVAVKAGFPPGHVILAQTFAAVGASVAVPAPEGICSAVQLLSSTSGAPTSATVIMEGSNDQTNWFTLPVPSYNGTLLAPYAYVRLRCTALAGGTTPTISAAFIANP